MKTALIVFSVVAILAALAYLIFQESKPEVAPVVKVTTPPATIVQPVYLVHRTQNGHTHNNQ